MGNMKLVSTYGLFNLINTPTRMTIRNAPSLIDICVTNSKNIVAPGTLDYNISDHLMVFAVSKYPRHNKGLKSVELRLHHLRTNYDLDLLKETQFNSGKLYATKDVDVVWSIIFNEIVRNADNFAPYCNQYDRKSQPGWFTPSLLEAAIERDRLLNVAKRSKNEKLFDLAKRKRNEV